MRASIRPTSGTRWLTVSALCALGMLGGCEAAPTSSPPDQLTVFAAASLHTAFEELGTEFEARHDEVEVSFSFAGSSDLVAQVGSGAPADVLVTADERTMAAAAESGVLAGGPVAVATNHLTLVTPPDNPADVTGLNSSLAGASLVTCAPQVPCGAAATRLAERIGIQLDPVSEGMSVTAVLGKVTSGQADAALVYTSDAAGAGDAVHAIPIPGAEDLPNIYPAAVIEGTDSPQLAQAWVEWLGGPTGRAVLTDAGFGPP